jgi:V/A-type H+-transporting ATPase subunit F
MLGLIIGDSDMVTGFRLVGVEGIEVSSTEEARQALEKALTRNDLAIVVVSEEFSGQPQMQKAIDKVRRERRNPLIVTVPSSGGEPSKIRLSDLVSRTLGIRV